MKKSFGFEDTKTANVQVVGAPWKKLLW